MLGERLLRAPADAFARLMHDNSNEDDGADDSDDADNATRTEYSVGHKADKQLRRWEFTRGAEACANVFDGI